MKKIKPLAGVSLAELIIAVAVLMIAVAAFATAFHVGLRTSAQARDLTVASIEAQMQMESLMGRPWVGAPADFPLWDAAVPANSLVGRTGTGYAGWDTPFPSNGLHVRIVHNDIRMRTCVPACGPTPPPPCAICSQVLSVRVTVYVCTSPTVGPASYVLRHSNILHVHPTAIF